MRSAVSLADKFGAQPTRAIDDREELVREAASKGQEVSPRPYSNHLARVPRLVGTVRRALSDFGMCDRGRGDAECAGFFALAITSASRLFYYFRSGRTWYSETP